MSPAERSLSVGTDLLVASLEAPYSSFCILFFVLRHTILSLTRYSLMIFVLSQLEKTHKMQQLLQQPVAGTLWQIIARTTAI